ncbi:hypothetical protein PoB_005217700 [Plakobranchus ocellatus]|uniref:Uncharacterized protein n=1 Tax=Plakobranchus ocellatus TaxID=259542 RepID=A0AAV4C2T5_9GAST|nr:hypothetical protein PoB_005217700 [Plakobranchus ocellatus]
MFPFPRYFGGSEKEGGAASERAEWAWRLLGGHSSALLTSVRLSGVNTEKSLISGLACTLDLFEIPEAGHKQTSDNRGPDRDGAWQTPYLPVFRSIPGDID